MDDIIGSSAQQFSATSSPVTFELNSPPTTLAQLPYVSNDVSMQYSNDQILIYPFMDNIEMTPVDMHKYAMGNGL